MNGSFIFYITFGIQLVELECQICFYLVYTLGI